MSRSYLFSTFRIDQFWSKTYISRATPEYSTRPYTSILVSTLLQSTPECSTCMYSSVLIRTVLESTHKSKRGAGSIEGPDITPKYSKVLISTHQYTSVLISKVLQSTPQLSTHSYSSVLICTHKYSTPKYSTHKYSSILMSMSYKMSKKTNITGF